MLRSKLYYCRKLTWSLALKETEELRAVSGETSTSEDGIGTMEAVGLTPAHPHQQLRPTTWHTGASHTQECQPTVPTMLQSWHDGCAMTTELGSAEG